MIWFVHLFNYPKGVSRRDGDAWYLTRHMPMVREQLYKILTQVEQLCPLRRAVKGQASEPGRR